MNGLSIVIAICFHLTASVFAEHCAFAKQRFATVLAFAAATVATVHTPAAALVAQFNV